MLALVFHMITIKMMGLPIPVMYPAEAYPAAVLVLALAPEPVLVLELEPAVAVVAVAPDCQLSPRSSSEREQ